MPRKQNKNPKHVSRQIKYFKESKRKKAVEFGKN